MHMNVLSGLLAAAIAATLADRVRSQGVRLGKLHWCDTACLCSHDEKMHCFEEQELYYLVEVDERQVQRLNALKFRLKEKLTWCTETCLCHQESRKEFKCTDSSKLGLFIVEKAPQLYPFLETEVVEEKIDEEEEKKNKDEERDRHDRKRNRKHRRNRKKTHIDKKETTEPTTEETIPDPETTPIPSTKETVTEPEANVLIAHVFPQASTALVGRQEEPDAPSRVPITETGPPTLEVPREKNVIAGKVSNDLSELREAVKQIQSNLDLNQQILWATILVAGIAMIGVLILAIYMCCTKRSSKSIPKSPRNTPHQQDGNNLTKANLDEAW